MQDARSGTGLWLFWPDYSGENPFQHMVRRAFRRLGDASRRARRGHRRPRTRRPGAGGVAPALGRRLYREAADLPKRKRWWAVSSPGSTGSSRGAAACCGLSTTTARTSRASRNRRPAATGAGRAGACGPHAQRGRGRADGAAHRPCAADVLVTPLGGFAATTPTTPTANRPAAISASGRRRRSSSRSARRAPTRASICCWAPSPACAIGCRGAADRRRTHRAAGRERPLRGARARRHPHAELHRRRDRAVRAARGRLRRVLLPPGDGVLLRAPGRDLRLAGDRPRPSDLAGDGGARPERLRVPRATRRRGALCWAPRPCRGRAATPWRPARWRTSAPATGAATRPRWWTRPGRRDQAARRRLSGARCGRAPGWRRRRRSSLPPAAPRSRPPSPRRRAARRGRSAMLSPRQALKAR